MITGLAITNLRGVRSGELRGLTPLTILTGVNGCGKSTVLDALLIAASPEPGLAMGQAVKRHPVIRNGARWLVGGSGEHRKGKITLTLDQEDGGSSTDTAKLSLRPGRKSHDLPQPISTIWLQRVLIGPDGPFLSPPHFDPCWCR